MNKSIIHHVSVINRDVSKTYEFYHDILGLSLLLKTVNQDDISMYHLFFVNKDGQPGTNFTIFEMQDGMDRKFGTNGIERIVFAVPSVESLYFWEKYLNELDLFNCEIEEYNDSKILRFEDFDGVQLGFVPARYDRKVYTGKGTEKIPDEHAIIGFDSVHLRVRYPEASAILFKQFFDLSISKTLDDEVMVLSSENTFLNQEIHLMEDKKSPLEVMGIGGSHHLAITVQDREELEEIDAKINERNFKSSGIKDREFFQSTYYREPNNILIEVATLEGHVPKVDHEKYASFDEIPLQLPEFLETRRGFITDNLKRL
ncbi:MAG TPA: VOC family protein [Candidatus Jeotgalibaca pullicola]|nr:VOC family protein [Candidatus Jeotgalibaca pullicola]